MTENTIITIAVCCGILVFIYLFMKKIIKGESWKTNLIEKASKNNCFTQATCIDRKLHLGNDDSGNGTFKNDRMKVKYEYQVNGRKYYKKLNFQSPGCVSVNYPYTITVYYKKNNPKKAVCKNEIQQTKETGCLIVFIVTIATILIVKQLLTLLLK